jgi:phenylalanyl-tRNA synthetase beta subunit
MPLWEAFLSVVEGLLKRLGIPYSLKSFYHTENSLWLEGVHLYQGERLLGTAGLLHPQYKTWAEIASEPVAYAEFDTEVLLSMPPRRAPHYEPLSLFPVVIKDVSFYKPPSGLMRS